ncbi:hypothetical protein DQG23_38930 [Paenibacillus contaminans]|uniref:Uncharacterized protein n=1 Tax=Paenibacillus contaminans TaxID=450362 RepID=A0A329LT59_9BACL|nr:hypothetical protein DQG23_38930 [Paenibacillus contaminans]
MYTNTLFWLFAGGVITLLIGMIASILIMKRQQHHNRDMKAMSDVTIKHPLLTNPVIIAQLLFIPIFLIILLIVNYMLK